MQFLRSGGGGGGGGGFGGAAWEVVRRHFSRKRSVDVRRINPKVPKEEAVAISGRLLQILSDHGPLTVGNTWNHAKDAGISGLNSKTHMKILLKWMTGRRIVKLSCVQVGNVKKFLYSQYTESSEAPKEASSSSALQEASAQGGKGKATRGQPKKKQAAALH
ncbi:hypothetical protein SETIT_9G007400v2 [Setaria italica]|uniref:Uncharacterized protein n=1 Tax=Setaria italica TaxID=4555 RepID=K4AG27_SETIT|nr:uncharacterized protein LOC101772933 [Setaria italica]RCV39896.1 hypothetical protein SETIT_9G007400v2 [Setaria italica]